MTNIININNTDINPIEYQGQRVITLSMIDKVHKRADGTAGRNFRQNKDKLIEGEDYFIVSSDEIRRNNPDAVSEATRRNDIVLVTETGYLMLVKSFQDDLAWQIQRRLVKGYFRAVQSNPLEQMLLGLQSEHIQLQREHISLVKAHHKLSGERWFAPRKWPKGESEQAVDMYADGKGPTEIGKVLGRTAESVRKHLKRVL